MATPAGLPRWGPRRWLFLPSTVLTVSGSRGHGHCRFCDCRLPIEMLAKSRQLEIGIRKCADSQPRSLSTLAPPKLIWLSMRFEF
jgi:hypothetical protein